MPTRPHSALAITALLTTSLVLGVASADTSSTVDLPTSMTNAVAGFTISYPPSWVVTTSTGANRIDFNDGLTFVIVDAFALDVRGTMLVMADEDCAYVIGFKAPAKAYASVEPTFWAMVASFQRHRAD